MACECKSPLVSGNTVVRIPVRRYLPPPGRGLTSPQQFEIIAPDPNRKSTRDRAQARAAGFWPETSPLPIMPGLGAILGPLLLFVVLMHTLFG